MIAKNIRIYIAIINSIKSEDKTFYLNYQYIQKKSKRLKVCIFMK